MSGHNKWSKIKHKKAASDAVKGKVFSKHSTIITMAVREAGGSITAPSVAAAIERAKKDSMPKENIERAIEKGQGINAANLEEAVFEGYGPGGVALIINAVTDNMNRTAPEIRHLFTKSGFALGTPGSALWAFIKTETGYVPRTPTDLDDVTADALADFVAILEEHDDVTDIFTSADSNVDMV